VDIIAQHQVHFTLKENTAAAIHTKPFSIRRSIAVSRAAGSKAQGGSLRDFTFCTYQFTNSIKILKKHFN
jgi:hypothetical protein